MNILAIDTSTAVLSVAIVSDDKVLAEYSINNLKMHSQKIMLVIDEVLKCCNMGIEDIDCYAVATGPGSFTGLRIGICTIKGFAYATEKPVVGIPTLDGLAANVLTLNNLICSIIDARNDQVYTAVYRYDEEKQIPVCITDYMAIAVDELLDILEKMGQSITVVGEASNLYGNRFLERLGSRCIIAPPHLNLCKASSISRLASLKAKSGNVQQSTDLLPFYIRQSQAERMANCD